MELGYVAALHVLAGRHFVRLARPRGSLVDGSYPLVDGLPVSNIPGAEWFFTLDADTRDMMLADFGTSVRVETLSSSFSLEGLAASPLYPELGVALTFDEILPRVKEYYQTNNVDTFEWMVEETAWSAIISARVEEFNKHSEVRARSGDAYIPGVIVTRSLRFYRERGVYVRRRGYARAVVLGATVNVPVRQAVLGVAPRQVAFAGVTWTGYVQYGGVVGYWVQFPTQVTSKMGFMQVGGTLLPHFLGFNPGQDKKRATITLVVAVNHDTDLRITWRRADDYRYVVDSAVISLARGTHRIHFTVADIRGLPPVLMQVDSGAPGYINRYEYSVS